MIFERGVEDFGNIFYIKIMKKHVSGGKEGRWMAEEVVISFVYSISMS